MATTSILSQDAKSASATTLINPAFLQEIKDSHPQLWETQKQLFQVCKKRSPTDASLSTLVVILDRIRNEMALEFALEESYGYQKVIGAPKAMSAAERISNSIPSELIESARSQHCGLYLQASELAERAEELQYRGVEAAALNQLFTETLDFDRRFREHEALECDLIDQSFELA